MIVKVGGKLAANDLLENEGETVGQVLVLGGAVLWEKGQRSV